MTGFPKPAFKNFAIFLYISYSSYYSLLRHFLGEILFLLLIKIVSVHPVTFTTIQQWTATRHSAHVAGQIFT